MYEQHWGLTGNPFQNYAGPEFFFRGETHLAALLKMRYLFENRLGAGLVTGGIGYGKSYLIHMLACDLPDGFGPVIHVLYPQLSARELLAFLAVELGADESDVTSQSAGLDRTVRQIEQKFVELSAQGRHPIIVIDDAHLIEDRLAFQALQLLLNFQQRADIEYTLILVGERELMGRVQRFAGLDARIAVKCVLQPLSKNEAVEYVHFRLETAGGRRGVFDDSALEALVEISAGVPRRINRLCDLSLLVGYADDLKQITRSEIEAVAEELIIGVAA